MAGSSIKVAPSKNGSGIQNAQKTAAHNEYNNKKSVAYADEPISSGKESNIRKQSNLIDMQAIKRTTMGHLIIDIENGEKPLSERDIPGPGPADYNPDYRKSSKVRRGPDYSLRTMIKPARPDEPSPGPIYNIATKFLQGKHRQISLKGRLAQLKGCKMASPSDYYPQTGLTGTQPHHVKATIKGRILKKYWPGLKAGLEQPCESAAYTNVDYLPLVERTARSMKFGDAPKWSLKQKLERIDETTGPGPAAYSRPTKFCCSYPNLGKTMSARPKPVEIDPEEITPGPDVYLPNMYDKPQNPRAVVLSRHMPDNAKETPAPNEYSLKNYSIKMQPRVFDGRGPIITYREHGGGDAKRPGPADYQVLRDNKAPGGTFSGSERDVIAFPDCLHYKTSLKSTSCIPGVGRYNCDITSLSRNNGPKHTFASKYKHTPGSEKIVAGPGDYNICGLTRKGVSAAPNYSLSGNKDLLAEKHEVATPASSDYYPKLARTGPSYTMSGNRDAIIRKSQGAPSTPGPIYNLRELTRRGAARCKHSGISFKSRLSPHVYSGLGCTTRKCFGQKVIGDSIRLG